MPVPTLARPVRVLRALAAALLLLGLGTALLAAPASAHVSLVGTVPAADEQVAVAPTQVELTYSASLLEVGNAVAVTGPSGPLALEPLQVDGRALVQPLPPDLPPGEYTVQWRAASGDGHPIEGAFAFTSVAPASGAATSPAPGGPAAAPSTTPSTSPSTGSSSATAVDPAGDGGLPSWVAVPVALLGAAGLAATVLRRGRHRGEGR